MKMVSHHIFTISDAEKYGVELAVLLYNVRFWTKHNQDNNQNLHDGRHWTFNSATALKKQFPYFSLDQIQRKLKKLVDIGALGAGCYNKNKYDRTLWYTALLDEDGKEVKLILDENGVPAQSDEVNNSANGLRRNAESTPQDCGYDTDRNAAPIPDVELRCKQSDVNSSVTPAQKAGMPSLFETYSEAFMERYGVTPIRNAKVNSQCKKIVEAVGIVKAIELVQYYITRDDAFYINKKHDIGLCLIDAHKLMVDMASGTITTQRRAQDFELSSHNDRVIKRFLEKEKEKKKKNEESKQKQEFRPMKPKEERERELKNILEEHYGKQE